MKNKIKKFNKKGSLPDIILIGVILLFFGVVVLFGFKITSEINSHVQSSDLIPADAKTATASLEGTYGGVIDNMFLFLAIGIGLVTLVLAALVSINPIFIPFYFIGLVIVIFMSGLLSNIYQEMASNPLLVAQATQLNFITAILTGLPIFVGVFGILLMIVMYKLWSVNQQ